MSLTMLLTIETDHSRGRATNADVVSARGASATVVPRREEIKEVVVFVDDGSLDRATVGSSLGKSRDRRAWGLSSARVQAEILLVQAETFTAVHTTYFILYVTFNRTIISKNNQSDLQFDTGPEGPEGKMPLSVICMYDLVTGESSNSLISHRWQDYANRQDWINTRSQGKKTYLGSMACLRPYIRYWLRLWIRKSLRCSCYSSS